MSDESKEWERVSNWIAKTIGGKIIQYERQARWRPAWFLDVEKDDRIISLYWRGDQGPGHAVNKIYPPSNVRLAPSRS